MYKHCKAWYWLRFIKEFDQMFYCQFPKICVKLSYKYFSRKRMKILISMNKVYHKCCYQTLGLYCIVKIQEQNFEYKVNKLLFCTPLLFEFMYCCSC